jgi:hypothetical protein
MLEYDHVHCTYVCQWSSRCGRPPWQLICAACWSVVNHGCCFLSWQVDLLARLPEVPRFQLAAMSLTGPGKAAMSVSMQRCGERP